MKSLFFWDLPIPWGYNHLPVPDCDLSRATTHRLKSKPGSRTGQEVIYNS